MAETTEKPAQVSTPNDLKKQQQKPLAERLAGQDPFNWIKLAPKPDAK